MTQCRSAPRAVPERSLPNPGRERGPFACLGPTPQLSTRSSFDDYDELN